MIDFPLIAQAALSNASNLLLYLFPQGHQTGREFCVGNLMGAPGDSLKVNLDTGKWTDFASGDKGGADLISLWARVRDCKNGEAAKEIAVRLGLSFSNGNGNVLRPETRYEIREEDNRLVAVHVRTNYIDRTIGDLGKRIRWETPDGSSGLGGIKVADLPLFGANRLRGWRDEGTDAVAVTEGEKAADSLVRRGIGAVGTVTGAAGTPSDKSLAPLLKFDLVVLWPDADPLGRKHMRRIAGALLRLGHQNVRIIEWTEAPEKRDAADFQGGRSEIEGLVTIAAKFEGGDHDAYDDHKHVTAGEDLTAAQGDILIADKFLAQHGEEVRYCPSRGWLLWNGQRWVWDEREHIMKLAEQTMRRLYREAADIEDHREREALIKLAATYSRVERIRGALAIARPRVAVVHDELDRNSFALNCRNGTVDLHDGRLQPHLREDLITKLTDIDYLGDVSKAPRFERFLSEISQGQAPLIEFTQRAVDYSFTGDQREQELYFLHGAGANGKSTLVQILLQAAGDYGHTAPAELLLARKFAESIPTDRADLCGKRFVVINETGDGRALAEALLKTITGGDVLTARHLYKNAFTFSPTHHIWLSSNHKPNVAGTDLGLWRRINLLPFDRTFGDDEADRELPVALQNELPGASWGGDVVQGGSIASARGRDCGD